MSIREETTDYVKVQLTRTQEKLTSKNEEVERLETLIVEDNDEVVEAWRVAGKEAAGVTSLQQQLHVQEVRGELAMLHALNGLCAKHLLTLVEERDLKVKE